MQSRLSEARPPIRIRLNTGLGQNQFPQFVEYLDLR